MAIEFLLDSLDGVEESIHGAYEEREGKFHFNPDKYLDLKSSGLKKNNADLKKEKDKLKKDYDEHKKKYSDFSDEDFESFKEWKERQALDGAGDGNVDGKKPDDLHKHYREQLKTEKTKWQTEKTTELAEKDKAIGEWRDKYRREKLVNNLTAWAAKADVFDDEIETYVDFLIFKGHFGLTEEDEIAYFDKAGDTTPSAIAPEKAISEQLKERYGRFYRSSEKGGSGSQNTSPGKSGGTDWRKLPPAERMAYGRKLNKARA